MPVGGVCEPADREAMPLGRLLGLRLLRRDRELSALARRRRSRSIHFFCTAPKGWCFLNIFVQFSSLYLGALCCFRGLLVGAGWGLRLGLATLWPFPRLGFPALLVGAVFRLVGLPRALKEALSRLPSGQSHLGNHPVIEAPVAAQDEAGERLFLDLFPAVEVPPKAREASELSVVVREAGGGHLMPCGAPEEHSGPEDLRVVCVGHGAVPEPLDRERHRGERPEVAIWWRQRLNQRRNRRTHASPLVRAGETRLPMSSAWSM